MGPDGIVSVAGTSGTAGPWRIGASAWTQITLILRISSVMAIAMILSLSVMGRLHASPITLVVMMDKALILRYPPATETIVVGNPVIADVTMVRRSGVVILTGKGYGETNIIFLDRAGTLLSESNLRVQPSSAMLSVQRGMDRETYSCHPRCEPVVSLGDGSQYLKSVTSDIATRNGAAAPQGGASQGGAPGMH